LKIASARSRASFSLSAKRSLPNIFENCARDAVAPEFRTGAAQAPRPAAINDGSGLPNRRHRRVSGEHRTHITKSLRFEPPSRRFHNIGGLPL
jgi:hypothetical protein